MRCHQPSSGKSLHGIPRILFAVLLVQTQSFYAGSNTIVFHPHNLWAKPKKWKGENHKHKTSKYQPGDTTTKGLESTKRKIGFYPLTNFSDFFPLINTLVWQEELGIFLYEKSIALKRCLDILRENRFIMFKEVGDFHNSES